MIISNYAVTASSQRTYLSVESTTVTAKQTIRPQQGAVTGAAKKGGKAEKGNSSPASVGDRVTLSDELKEKLAKLKEDSIDFLAQKSGAASVMKTGKGSKLPKNPEELKLSLLEMMLEMMSGKKVKLRLSDDEGSFDGRGFQGFAGNAGGMSGQIVDGLRIEQYRYESEQVSYQAQGIISTADGMTINVDVNMYMSREFASYTNTFVETERPCDPLVINYGGTAASLSGEKFDFDLDFDGKMDRISSLGEGSGFLALDRNGDGKINDGRELFGPNTGNGFGELRAFDSDGNGWIDEADDIFSKLRIWSRDKYGKEQLFTLKELGIGAIYLGDINTEFSFKNDSNITQGVMRSTSFFLKEQGGAGTISHVDMMI